MNPATFKSIHKFQELVKSEPFQKGKAFLFSALTQPFFLLFGIENEAIGPASLFNYLLDSVTYRSATWTAERV